MRLHRESGLGMRLQAKVTWEWDYTGKWSENETTQGEWLGNETTSKSGLGMRLHRKSGLGMRLQAKVTWEWDYTGRVAWE